MTVLADSDCARSRRRLTGAHAWQSEIKQHEIRPAQTALRSAAGPLQAMRTEQPKMRTVKAMRPAEQGETWTTSTRTGDMVMKSGFSKGIGRRRDAQGNPSHS